MNLTGRLSLILAAVVGSGMLLAACGTGGSSYPSKTIVFSTHSNPGGGGDILGRQLAEALKKQNINAVLENRAGGSGAVNVAYVASKPADGYTLAIVTLSNLITPILASTPHTYKDFRPVAQLQTENEAILVRADAKWQTVEDLVKEAKENPGKIKWGGGFLGNIDSLVAFQLGNVAGYKVDYVPFEGGGEVTTALLGGHVLVAVSNPAESVPQLEAKQFRMLAITSDKRSPIYKDVPTLKEKGINVVQEQWRGVWAPKGTPDDVVKRLEEILPKAMKEESFQKYMKDGMLAEAFLGSADFTAALEKQDKEISTLIDQLGLRGSQTKK